MKPENLPIIDNQKKEDDEGIANKSVVQERAKIEEDVEVFLKEYDQFIDFENREDHVGTLGKAVRATTASIMLFLASNVPAHASDFGLGRILSDTGKRVTREIINAAGREIVRQITGTFKKKLSSKKKPQSTQRYSQEKQQKIVQQENMLKEQRVKLMLDAIAQARADYQKALKENNEK